MITQLRVNNSNDPQVGVALAREPGPQYAFDNWRFHEALQFALLHAVGCVLHRSTSRVIHRLELCNF